MMNNMRPRLRRKNGDGIVEEERRIDGEMRIRTVREDALSSLSRKKDKGNGKRRRGKLLRVESYDAGSEDIGKERTDNIGLVSKTSGMEVVDVGDWEEAGEGGDGDGIEMVEGEDMEDSRGIGENEVVDMENEELEGEWVCTCNKCLLLYYCLHYWSMSLLNFGVAPDYKLW